MENVQNDTKKHLQYKKETYTQLLVLMTQTEILHIKLDSQIDTDECLDAINTSGRYIISDLMKMRDSSGTDSDDD